MYLYLKRGKSVYIVLRYLVFYIFPFAWQVRVHGGKGGDGSISFLSVYMIEWAGKLYVSKQYKQ
jgi:hypothetical protein